MAPPSLPTAIPGNNAEAVIEDGSILYRDDRATPSSPKQVKWSVETALAKAGVIPPTKPPTTPIPFFHFIERLKTTPREGWRRFSIHHGESISDHMYRMAIITMLAPPSLASKLDLNRCTRMALVHDMGEALVGDITPVDGVSKEEKSRRETLSMAFLTGTLLGSTSAGERGTNAAKAMRDVWEEYERSETLESKFVHDVDKLELVLQMIEYEKRYDGKIDLGEFAWVAGRIALPEMQQWAAEILAERERFWEALGKGEAVENWDMGNKLRKALGVDKTVDAAIAQQNGA